MAYIWSYNDYRKSWEIGYAVLPDYQKFGYGIESASLLLKFGFRNLKAHKIVGMCNSENLGSSRIMQKVGMCREEFSEKNCFGMGNGLTNIFFQY